MFKLTKDERKRIDIYSSKLSTLRGKLDAAIEAFNEGLDKLREDVDGAVGNYNEALDEARGFLEDIVSQCDEDLSNKSEKWLEGEKGQSVESWKEDIEQRIYSMGNIEIEYPENISLEDEEDHSALLDEMPEDPDSIM